MGKILLLFLFVFAVHSAQSKPRMVQVCQVTNHDMTPEGANKVGAGEKIALPGVLIIEQLAPEDYSAERLVNYIDYEPDSPENAYVTPWVPARVRFFLDLNFGMNTGSFEAKALELIESSDSQDSSKVRVYNQAMVRRYQDWTHVTLDGSKNKNTNKLVWRGSDSGSAFKAEVVNEVSGSTEIDLRYLICSPRYTYETSEAQSTYDQAYLTDGRDTANKSFFASWISNSNRILLLDETRFVILTHNAKVSSE